MLTLIAFRQAFRGETVWINPEQVRSVQRRTSGVSPQTCIRLAGLSDDAEVVVEGPPEAVIEKLTGVPIPAASPRRAADKEISPAKLKALAGELP